METQKIYNLIILDASGSMQSIYNQAFTGVNETLDTIRMAQKDHPELEQYVTLASFSSGEYFLNRIYTAVPIAEARDITPRDYIICGATALYDAMGTCISELQQVLKHEDRVLVTIITDGYENASHIWNGSQIKSLVGELRQMGWTFTYIGANQDVEKVAGEMGIKNTLVFASTPAGTESMFDMDRKSRSGYYAEMAYIMRSGENSREEISSYFAEPKSAEPKQNTKEETEEPLTIEPKDEPADNERKKSLMRRLLGMK